MLLIVLKCNMYSAEAQLEIGGGKLSGALELSAGELRKQKRLYCSSSCRLHVHHCGDATYSSQTWAASNTSSF